MSRGTSNASSIHISDMFCSDNSFVSSSSPKNMNWEPLLSVIVLSVLLTLHICFILKKSSCSLISCHTVCITVLPYLLQTNIRLPGSFSALSISFCEMKCDLPEPARHCLYKPPSGVYNQIIEDKKHR